MSKLSIERRQHAARLSDMAILEAEDAAYGIGYFAIPDSDRSTMVHVIDKSSLAPSCRIRVGQRTEAVIVAHGIREEYIECSRCREMCDFLRNLVIGTVSTPGERLLV